MKFHRQQNIPGASQNSAAAFSCFFFGLILVCWRRFTSHPRVSSLETPSRNWKKSSCLRCSTWIYHNQDDWEASSTWHGSLQLVQRNLLKSRDPKLFWKDTILASERVPISMRMSRTWLYFKFWVIFSFKRIVHLWCFHPFTLHSWIPQNENATLCKVYNQNLRFCPPTTG